MSFADYEAHDATGLAELVRTGQVSAGELVEAAIERIERHDPALNAVVHRQYERARREAGGPLPEGPFRGVPMLLKDLLGEQEGEPSTSSCRLFADWRAPRDNELVARFRRAGVVIVGRTNTPELGIYAVTEPALRGPAHNPWDLSRTPGGSSGGSAAAVAARMVPIAHGGDGGGSIRIPASHCGLVGLKPTRGRNPMGPAIGERWGGLVAEHVLTRSVRDSAAMLDATSGVELGAPYQVVPPARPFLSEVGAPTGKLRIAFTTRALFGDATDPECVAAVESTARLLRELGHEVEEACPPFDKPALIRGYLTRVAAGVADTIRGAAEKTGREPRPRDLEAPTWLMKLIADKLSASDYVSLASAIHRAGHEIAEWFTRFDALLTATVARPPVPIGTFRLKPVEVLQSELLRRAPLRPLLMIALDKLAGGALAATPNTMLWNLTGQPAISLPLHWSGDGLPIGTQLVGRFGDEATLLRLASQLEAARPWAHRRPPLIDGGTR